MVCFSPLWKNTEKAKLKAVFANLYGRNSRLSSDARGTRQGGAGRSLSATDPPPSLSAHFLLSPAPFKPVSEIDL